MVVKIKLKLTLCFKAGQWNHWTSDAFGWLVKFVLFSYLSYHLFPRIAFLSFHPSLLPSSRVSRSSSLITISFGMGVFSFCFLSTHFPLVKEVLSHSVSPPPSFLFGWLFFSFSAFFLFSFSRGNWLETNFGFYYHAWTRLLSISKCKWQTKQTLYHSRGS